MSVTRTILATLVIGSLPLVSCGGSADSSSGAGEQQRCPSITPCGGDITGKWRMTDVCLDEHAFAQACNLPSACADAVSDAHMLSSDAVYTFDAQGVSTTTGSTEMSYKFTYTKACVVALSGETLTGLHACRRAIVRMTIKSLDVRSSARCAFANDQYVNMDGSGTYVTSGTNLVVYGGPSAGSSGYFVGDNRLTIIAPEGNLVFVRPTRTGRPSTWATTCIPMRTVTKSWRTSGAQQSARA